MPVQSNTGGITQSITHSKPAADNTITIPGQGTHTTVAPGGEYHTGTSTLATAVTIQDPLIIEMGDLATRTNYLLPPEPTNPSEAREYDQWVLATFTPKAGFDHWSAIPSQYNLARQVHHMLYGGDVGPNDHIAKPPVNRATRTSSGGVGWIPPELERYLTGTAENIRNIATLGWSYHFGLTNTKKYNYDANGSWTLFYWQSICFTVAREAPLLAFTMSTRAALLGGQGFWRASPYARTLWTTLGPRNLQLLLRAEMGVHALNAGYHGLQVVGNVRDVYNNPTNPEAWLNLGVNSGITILNAFGAKTAYGTRLNGWNVAAVSGGTKRVTQYFDPKKVDFPIEGRYALSSQPTAGNRLMDGITETTTFIAPRPASEMNMFRRMMTGVGTRRNYVEFDVLPNELIGPSGSKRLYGAWQQTISGQVDLVGRNAVYGVKGTNYLDYGFRYIVIPGGILRGGYVGYQFLNSENN